jgi:hypothetical protein
MISPFAVHTAVTRLGDNGEIRTGQLDPRGERQGPAVEAVEVVHIEVMGHLGGLADPRGKDDPISRHGKLMEDRLQNVPDGEIAATGTPGGIDFCFHRFFSFRTGSATL